MSSYYHLRQLRPVIRSLSSFAKKTLVQAFITSRLDYCNSLLYGIADSLLKKLQSVQNASARLITGARRREHMTPVLRDLHWLPVKQRVVFKVASMMYLITIGRLPPYKMAVAKPEVVISQLVDVVNTKFKRLM